MSSASEGGVDALRIYGNLSLLEMAPVLLAAEEIMAKGPSSNTAA